MRKEANDNAEDVASSLRNTIGQAYRGEREEIGQGRTAPARSNPLSSENNPRILHDHEIKETGQPAIFNSPKRPETSIGSNEDTRIEEDWTQTAEIEHPQRDMTSLLCTPDIANSAQESALSNISVQAEVGAKDAGHREDVSQVRASFGIETRSKTETKQTEITSNTANMPSRADRTALIHRKKSASREKTTLADHTDEQGSDRDTVPAGTEMGVVVKGAEILGNIWDKAGRAGRVEVMREVLYDMISALRARQKHEAPRSSLIPHVIAPSCFQGELGFSGLAGRFQALRDELEITSATV
jgi:hypothetical protein